MRPDPRPRRRQGLHPVALALLAATIVTVAWGVSSIFTLRGIGTSPSAPEPSRPEAPPAATLVAPVAPEASTDQAPDLRAARAAVQEAAARGDAAALAAARAELARLEAAARAP